MTFASYIRVSTQRQGESGLGLEAQRAAIDGYFGHAHANVMREFQEIESGKRNDRPVLAEALKYCRQNNATLVIAKLDRLARNVAFIAALMDSDVEFVCCDFPQANRLLLHIMAAVAEHEAQQISERTKASLAAAKARGTKLGASNPKCQNLTAGARGKGAMLAGQTARKAAVEAYAPLVGVVQQCREAGVSWDAIAKRFNDNGHRTRTGHLFSGPIIRRIFMRAGLVEPAP